MAFEPLTELEQLLLYALLHLGDDAYGVTIRRLVHERAGRLLSPGAIYASLSRLESRGLVRSSLGEPTPKRGGKRKRIYRIQASGERALKDTRAALAGMARGVAARLDTR